MSLVSFLFLFWPWFVSLHPCIFFLDSSFSPLLRSFCFLFISVGYMALSNRPLSHSDYVMLGRSSAYKNSVPGFRFRHSHFFSGLKNARRFFISQELQSVARGGSPKRSMPFFCVLALQSQIPSLYFLKRISFTRQL